VSGNRAAESDRSACAPAAVPPGSAEPQLGSTPLPGWRTRGYLPHRDEGGLRQAITFRLADSLPREQLAALEQRLALAPEDTRTRERRSQLDAWLDAGYGCCALAHSAVASLMVATLRRFDPVRYRLIAWCVMPNHVHVLIAPRETLGRIVQSWKS
jgi:type I restriction enzyme R subunit/putative DNA methylase